MSIVPGTHVMYTVRPGDSPYSIAQQFGASLQTLVRANALYPPITDPGLIYPGQKMLVRVPGMSQQSTVLHQVTEGDTLYGLAARYTVGVELLAAVNQIQQPDFLRVAQLLYVPAFVYEVVQGDTLYRIARQHGVSLNTLLQANRQRPGLSSDLIYEGYRLVVPLPSSANIVVYEPLPSTTIVEGQQLTGTARAFEGTVLVQIVDADGQIVTAETVVTAEAGGPAFAPFSTMLSIGRMPSTATGTLMVYTRSMLDNSIQDLVEIPIRF